MKGFQLLLALFLALACKAPTSVDSGNLDSTETTVAVQSAKLGSPQKAKPEPDIPPNLLVVVTAHDDADMIETMLKKSGQFWNEKGLGLYITHHNYSSGYSSRSDAEPAHDYTLPKSELPPDPVLPPPLPSPQVSEAVAPPPAPTYSAKETRVFLISNPSNNRTEIAFSAIGLEGNATVHTTRIRNLKEFSFPSGHDKVGVTAHVGEFPEFAYIEKAKTNVPLNYRWGTEDCEVVRYDSGHSDVLLFTLKRDSSSK